MSQKRPAAVPDAVQVASASSNNSNSSSSSRDDDDVLSTSFFFAKEEFLNRHLLPFLSINDATILSQTCRHLRKIVHSSRRRSRGSSSSSYPFLIWEERRPTKIGYRTFVPYSKLDFEEGTRISISQIQPFRFIWKTADEQFAKVDFSLINDAWHEYENNIDGEVAHESWTAPCIAIKKLNHEQDGCLLFEVKPWQRFYDDAVEFNVRVEEDEYNIGWDDYTDWEDELTPDKITIFRDSMDIVFKCAKRIAVYPRHGEVSYPSAKYLMQQLPHDFRPYFPDGLEDEIDQGHFADRETVIEFRYRPALTLEEWKDIFGVVREYEMGEYELDEVPWYRDGYWDWLVNDGRSKKKRAKLS